jgi:hypothetical protein
VDEQPVSELLPVLYRAVLDSVAELERLGFRRDAAKIRADATNTYSRAWNRAGSQRLQALRTRAARIAEGRRRRRPVALETLGRVDVGGTSA